MKKLLFAALMLWGMGSALPAAVLQDWSALDASKDAGTFADTKGSKVSFSLVPGLEGQKALQIDTNLTEWGGVWTALGKNLSKVKAIKFKAKSSAPTYLMIGLNDDQKDQYIAYVKIVSDDWTEFVVPLALFQKTPWPMPDAPKDGQLNLAKIDSLTFQPQARGSLQVSVGPLSGESGRVKAATGAPNPEDKNILVQDFTMLDKDAYGPFADDKTGAKITLSLEKGGEAMAGWVAKIKYSMKPEGWCGIWMRAGDRWGGQDWTGAKRLTCKVYSSEPIYIDFGFNDANQNAYVAHFPQTKGKGWETLTLPFEKFDLNEYYQPPEAKKDQPLDLSHIETFNIAPQAKGDHEFQLGELNIEK